MVLLRRHGDKLCDIARDVLVCVAGVDPSLVSCACAETGVPEHEKLTVLWRQEAQPEDVSEGERARIAALSKRFADNKLPEETLEVIARSAASSLAAWPIVESPVLDYESILLPVEGAADQVRNLML